MVAVVLLVVVLVLSIAVLITASLLQDASDDYRPMRRVDAEVAMAIAGLRRNQRDVIRRMHETVKPFIDIESEEP